MPVDEQSPRGRSQQKDRQKSFKKKDKMKGHLAKKQNSKSR